MEATHQPHIEFSNLKKYYQLGETVVKALDDVSMSINPGEFVIIVGASGSGKSTLVNMLGGVDQPDSGIIRVNGYELHKLNSGELTGYRRDHVGFVFQFYSLVPTLTASENIELAAELVNLRRNELRSRVAEVLEAVGLKGRGNSYPSQLSGGERQRVALARALAKHPDLIIVDEPTGQLDATTGRNMIELIKKVAKEIGATVLMVTHDTSLLDLGDRIIQMNSGKLEVKN